ncbi:hypothetical protein WA026_005068 [Henosepilachna vigintioctopunctata]
MCGGQEKDASLGFQVLQTLLSHNDIDVAVEDSDGRQPLLWAASAGSSKAILSLIRAGSSVEAADKDGLTALHCAASRGHTDCIDSLLTLCGASPDIIDSNGCTALHYAVTLGHADATALLLAHGSDPNRQDRKGRSPAHCGCSKGQFETVKMIGSHGANLWLKNARGDLPLHEAAASGRRDLVKWLLTMRPSQVNARNNDGRCPLHLAALNDNADMCKILLDAGAQINPVLRTSKNTFMTPLDCALRRGFRSTAKYLQLHGGVPASRLGSGHQQTNPSALSLQIRDDITFWGDSSTDSERENGEFNKHIKAQKKKLTQKYDRKRTSASGSDIENRISAASSKSKRERKHSKRSKFPQPNAVTDSASSSFDPKYIPKRSSRSRFDYTNEITINGNTEINIHQTREISVVGDNVEKSVHSDSPKKLTSKQYSENEVYSEKERNIRPKSAKYGGKLRTSISDSERSSTAKSSASQSNTKVRREEQRKYSERILRDQGTNTALDSEDKISEKQIDKSDVGVLTDETLNIQTSQQSGITKLPDQYSRMSDTSEDQEKHENIIVEAAVHEPPKEYASKLESSDNIKETEENLEQENESDQLIENEKEEKTVEEADSIESKVEKISTEHNIEDESLVNKEVPIPNTSEETIDEKVTTNDQILIEADIEKVEQGENVSENKENETKENTNQIETNGNAEDISEIETKKSTHNLRRILSHETFLRNQSPSPENVDSSNGTNEITEPPLGVISINIEQELSLKLHGTAPSKESEDKEDLEVLETQRTRSEDTSLSTTDIATTADTVKEVSADQSSDTSVKQDEKHSQINSVEEDTMMKAFGEIIADETEVTPGETKTKFIKQPQSEDTKPSSIKTPTTCDSTTSSLSESKTHKSFTVLDEKETKINSKTRKMKTRSGKPKLKKQRSKSEENKKNEVSTPKPSKIPTALGRSILSKSDRYLNEVVNKEEETLNRRIPSLPDMAIRKQYRSQSNLSARKMVLINSDEKGSVSEDEEQERRISGRRKRTKRRIQRRDSRSAGSDYESSNIIDSGFEPSPRSTRAPRWRNMSDRGVNMSSVTQNIQSNIRRYHLERKIFQHLLDLKRMQIRSGQHNEAMLVKRAIDGYHNSCASTVGAGKYVTKELTFKAFEKFLYDSLRKLQQNESEHLKGLPEAPSNPLLCTRSTHRCMHATHAYTGVPCAAYLPKLDHHTIPKIGFNSCKPGTGGFLPNINTKKNVTLELCHGSDKQIISLPADRLDQNKRYYVTFTVKGAEAQPSNDERDVESAAHRHSRSD